MTAAALPAERYVLLDGLRGVAALLVTALHCTQALPQYGIYLTHAHLAVDFFFALSGFVLSLSYGQRLGHSMSGTEFMLRRFIRLSPMLVLGVLIATLAYLVKLIKLGQPELIPELLGTSVLNMLYLPSPWLHQMDHGNAFLPNPPTWSLTAEMVASVFFALVLVRTPLKRLLAILGLAFIGIVCIAVEFNTVDEGWQWPNLWIGFVRVAFSFTIGVVIHRLIAMNCFDFVLTGSRWAYSMCLALILLLTLPIPESIVGLYELSSVAVFFPLIILGAARVVGRLHAYKLLDFLGQISFPLYAVHYGVLRLLGPLRASGWAEEKPGLVLLIQLLVCCLIAWCALIWVDVPVRRWLTARMSRMNRSPMAVSI